MPTVTSGSISLNYHVTGQGPPLMLIGGLGMPMQGWALQVRSLSRNFQVIRMDNRGCGGSTIPDTPFSIQDMADDVMALIDHLGLERVHLLGLSMGGFIALELALKAPRSITSLILAHTAPKTPDLARHRIRLWQTMEQESIPPELRARDQMLWVFPETAMTDSGVVDMLVNTLVIGINAQSPKGFAAQANACDTFDVSGRLQEINAPALIITARDDISIPADHTRKLERLANVRTLKMFESAGHVSHLVHADEFNRTVMEFIHGVEAENP